MKKTKIVCTIGPASDSEKTLKKLFLSGMNVARLNFSHNTHAYHMRVFNRIRKISQKMNLPIAILQDLQGPRIRVGEIAKEGIILKKNSEVILTGAERYSKLEIPVTYAKLAEDLQFGERVLIEDGLIKLKVKKILNGKIYCEVLVPGKIISHKGLNFPDSKLSISSLSDKDKEDLKLGVRLGVDYMALSFVREAQEVLFLRRLIEEEVKNAKIKQIYPIKIIVKVEQKEAIDNFSEILQVSDGIMVARGDLGIEMPAEDVPILQKMIIDRCLSAHKPVIVATQMLDSMIKNPQPTRAEVSDVANAVIDHTDAVMLSGETAFGQYPVEAVEMMSRIIKKTEDSIYDDLVIQTKTRKIVPSSDAIAKVAKILSQNIPAKLILVASLSGESARIVSRYRPDLPIYAITADERIRRQLNLSWGILSFNFPKVKEIEKLVDRAIVIFKKQKLVKKNEQIIVITGSTSGKTGINSVEIKVI
ncbi:MAG: pyruvate kinase [Patescibacteria group bacterium]